MRSINNKLNDLHVEIANKYDIIAVCETWLNDSTPDSLINCNDTYTIIRKDRNTRGGGVCLFLSKLVTSKFTVRNVVIPDLFQSLEIVCVDIFCCGITSRLVLVYRPPNYNCDENKLLSSALRHLSSKAARLALIGNFNLPTVDWKCANNI